MLFISSNIIAQSIGTNCLQEICGGLCYDFTSPHPSGTTNNWNFGDGTGLSTTDVTVKHCYTDVNTFANINESATVSLTATVAPTFLSTTIQHSSCQKGVFIGDVDGSPLSYLSTYAALPGNVYDGLNNTATPRDVFMYSTIFIDKDFTFQRTNVNMNASAGIHLEGAPFSNPWSLTLEDDTKVSIKQGCDCLWQGILVTTGGKLITKTNTSIENALYGIFVRDKDILDIQQTNFFNNYIGIVGWGYPTLVNFDGFSDNTFSTTATLQNWCGGQSILNDPYAPTGGVFNTDQGWAGIYLYSFHTGSIGESGGQVNVFKDLANGIVIYRSSVGEMASPPTITGGIQQCQFDNIKRGNYPLNLGGRGIQFIDHSGGNHFMRQVGSGMNNIANPSFNNCEVGVHAQYPYWGGGSMVESNNNRMENMQTGYQLNGFQGGVNASITFNHIISNQDFSNGGIAGVRVDMGAQTPSTKLNIDDNTIEVAHSTAVNCSGILVFNVGPDFSIGGEVTANDNDITIGGISGTGGITMSNTGGYVAKDNIITITNDVNCDGINDFGSNSGSLLCNDITGPQPVQLPGALTQNGLDLFFANDVNVRDNNITNFDRGVEFSGPCGSEVDFGCNDILGNNVVGLFYKSDLIINPQEDKGNNWDCTSTTFEAQSISSNFAGQYYTAESGTDAFPDPVDPTLGWFIPSSIQTPPCPVDPDCPLMVIEKEINELDVAIAQELITGPAGIIYSAEKALYRKLKKNPDLLIGDTLMQSFVNAKASTPLGEFYDLSEDLSSLFVIDNLTQTQLTTNASDLENHLAQMKIIDAILATNPPEPQFSNYVQEYAQHALDIIQLNNDNEAIYQSLHTSRLASANNMLATNSAINAVEVYELNEQKVYDIYLNTIGKDTTNATTTQVDTLASIAAQCPADGGRAVLWAIALHGAFTGSHLEVQECVSGRSKEQEEVQVFQDNHFSLYPNPSNGTCNVKYQLEKGQESRLVVVDFFGRQVHHLTLSGSDGIVELDALPPGIYFVELFVNNELFQTEKLIKH